MASGSIFGTTNNQYITCRLDWASTPDAANNRSSVSVGLYLKKSSQSTSHTTGTGYFRLSADGATQDWSGAVDIPNDNVWRLVHTYSLGYIAHGADGSKSLGLALVDTGNYSGLPGTTYTDSYLSGTAALDTLLLAPTAPTIGTAARVTDVSATIGWTNNPGARSPYSSLTVERQTDGGAWVQVSTTLAGTTTSYTDDTVTANHGYAYRVMATNSAGTATSAASAAIYNTPAAPSSCAATKTGATQVTVTCVDNSNTETAFEWERTADAGASWTAVGSTGAGVTTYVDNAAPGGTIAYRVRATRSTLVSAYSATSNSVTTTTPPAAPTLTAWPAYSATGSVIRVGWTHNTLDGSAQSKADIVYTKDGVETTYALTGATAYYDIPITGLAAAKVVTVKVRTYGLHATAGAYSGIQSTTLANQPQAAITTPGSDSTVVADVPLTVAWNYTDAFAQAGYELRLSRAGVLVGTWTGTTATSQAIGAAYLLDDSAFSLELTVRSASGFSVTTTRTFTTNYVAPTPPTVYAEFDPATLAVMVTASAGTVGALPATDHLVLHRLDTFDGTTTTAVIADPLAPGSVVTDRTPRLGQDVTYRVLALAANGAYSTTDVTVRTTASGYYALNFGDGAASLLKMRFNHDVAHSSTDDSEVLTFADRALPVVYAGEHVSETISLSAVVMDDASRAAMRALRSWRRAATYRERDGYRARVKVESVSDKPGPSRGTTAISISMTVVE